MHRTLSAILASGLLASSAVLAAQTPTTTTAQSPATTTTADKWDAKDITVTGCVEKTKSGGYFLMASSADAGSAATTTGTSGAVPPSATTTTGAATTTDDNDHKAHGAAWNLGQSDKLERYVGQRVQVVGRPEKDTSGDQLKGTHGGGEIKARDIDVKTVTVVSSSCR